MAIERSLILLKPDCLDGRYAGEVISRFEKAGFTIREAKEHMARRGLPMRLDA